MDGQLYYKLIRQKRDELTVQFPQGFCVAVSVQNLPANAKAGGMAEVSVGNLARMIVDGSARLATDAESATFHSEMDAARARRAPDSMSRLRLLYDEVMSERT
jgi:uncharacterized protein (DUF1501 family)